MAAEEVGRRADGRDGSAGVPLPILRERCLRSESHGERSRGAPGKPVGDGPCREGGRRDLFRELEVEIGVVTAARREHRRVDDVTRDARVARDAAGAFLPDDLLPEGAVVVRLAEQVDDDTSLEQRAIALDDEAPQFVLEPLAPVGDVDESLRRQIAQHGHATTRGDRRALVGDRLPPHRTCGLRACLQQLGVAERAGAAGGRHRLERIIRPEHVERRALIDPLLDRRNHVRRQRVASEGHAVSLLGRAAELLHDQAPLAVGRCHGGAVASAPHQPLERREPQVAFRIGVGVAVAALVDEDRCNVRRERHVTRLERGPGRRRGHRRGHRTPREEVERDRGVRHVAARAPVDPTLEEPDLRG